MQRIDWKVRKAEPYDASSIVELARGDEQFLMPYILSETVVKNYVDQMYVAEYSGKIGGAIHFVSFKFGDFTRQTEFLRHVKLVDELLIQSLVKESLGFQKIAFIIQLVCPGKGTFTTILNQLKKEYDQIWCWMSVRGPSFKSYVREGFEVRRKKFIWNVYKSDYSEFVHGVWRK